MNLELDPSLSQFVSELVASGQFASEADVIREGLTLLRQRSAERMAALEDLRKKIQVGLDEMERGEVAPLDIAAIREEGMRILAARAHQKAAD
jgi:antitoxin ParD1/3/4